MWRYSCFVLVALIGAACATPYQERGLRGGYEAVALRKGHYIHVETNVYTTAAKAAAYFHRQSQELCPDGYRVFEGVPKESHWQESALFSSLLPFLSFWRMWAMSREAWGHIRCIADESPDATPETHSSLDDEELKRRAKSLCAGPYEITGQPRIDGAQPIAMRSGDRMAYVYCQ